MNVKDMLQLVEDGKIITDNKTSADLQVILNGLKVGYIYVPLAKNVELLELEVPECEEYFPPLLRALSFGGNLLRDLKISGFVSINPQHAPANAILLVHRTLEMANIDYHSYYSTMPTNYIIKLGREMIEC